MGADSMRVTTRHKICTRAYPSAYFSDLLLFRKAFPSRFLLLLLFFFVFQVDAHAAFSGPIRRSIQSAPKTILSTATFLPKWITRELRPKLDRGSGQILTQRARGGPREFLPRRAFHARESVSTSKFQLWEKHVWFLCSYERMIVL